MHTYLQKNFLPNDPFVIVLDRPIRAIYLYWSDFLRVSWILLLQIIKATYVYLVFVEWVKQRNDQSFLSVNMQKVYLIRFYEIICMSMLTLLQKKFTWETFIYQNSGWISILISPVLLHNFENDSWLTLISADMSNENIIAHSKSSITLILTTIRRRMTGTII